MSATSSLASVVMIAKVRSHSPRSRVLPIFPDAGNAERCTIFHCDCVRLLRFLALDGLPLEETVDRHDAAALTVRIPKCRQVPHRLAFGIDGFTAARRVIAPIWDEAPTQRVERHIAGPVIAADDQQFLA